MFWKGYCHLLSVTKREIEVMELYDQIFENNRKWVAEKKVSDDEFFDHLAEGQNPEILYIGCSDSRVTAEDMTGMEPGQMFVHRNIGNLVPNNDLNSSSVVEFAVDHLKVKHIVVCGHYYCGAIAAAMQAKDLGLLNPWLRNIRLHMDELDAIANEEERNNRLTELNVLEQCVNVIKMAVVQKHYLDRGFPRVHGWVFDVKTGILKDLNLDFEGQLGHIQKIYDLGTQQEVMGCGKEAPEPSAPELESIAEAIY